MDAAAAVANSEAARVVVVVDAAAERVVERVVDVAVVVVGSPAPTSPTPALSPAWAHSPFDCASTHAHILR